jgi:uncharacterized protein (TIGR02270 family)
MKAVGRTRNRADDDGNTFMIRRGLGRPVVETVVELHADDLGLLWLIRRDLTTAPHAGLRQLGRFDRRIAAHIDGCLEAHDAGAALLQRRLDSVGPSELFATAVVALEAQDEPTFGRCIQVGAAVPSASDGVTSALGWVSPARLSGIVRNLLTAEAPAVRRLGLAACRLHGVDAGASALKGLADDSPGVRAAAARLEGTIGSLSRPEVRVLLTEDSDPETHVWFVWAAVLLGDRDKSRLALTHAALNPGPLRERAFRLALQATEVSASHAVLQQLAADPSEIPRVIQGSGITGDPTYVPWLISHMADDRLARLAGEAFSLITGADLALLDLERKPPENFESGPNDDPDDPNVDMDPDEGLPWPDQAKVQAWWNVTSHRFQPGMRYFMGGPVTREHCIDVLKNGYQRQRILAAHYLCLLEPGTPLFNTSAPAWRQQKLLAQMA